MPETTTETPSAAPAWFSGVTEPDLIGHAQTKGWDRMEPTAAFSAAARAHREAESRLGIPPDQILRLPKEATDAAWKDVWQRLGAPKDAKEYSFDGVEFETPEMTTRFLDTVRATAAELNIPKAMAERLVQTFHKFVGDLDSEGETARTNALSEAKSRLEKSWGPNMEANRFVASQAATAFGFTADEIAALENTTSYDTIMERFRQIGARIGEDKFVASPNGGGKGPMTREQAVARKNELLGDGRPGTGDVGWQKRYQEGGVGSTEFKELQGLLTLIAA